MQNEIISCAVCKKTGELVSTITVKSLSIKPIKVDNAKFFLCLNPECDVAYYSDSAELVLKDEIKVPIWFKTNAHPEYICYCSKVEKQEILDAINNMNLKTVGDVVKNTNAMKISDCIHNSPTGKCCSRQIKELIELNKK